MAYSQTDIDKLKAAMASGARMVKFGDIEVLYRSYEEMQAQLAQMESELNNKSKIRYHNPTFSRGY